MKKEPFTKKFNQEILKLNKEKIEAVFFA